MGFWPTFVMNANQTGHEGMIPPNRFNGVAPQQLKFVVEADFDRVQVQTGVMAVIVTSGAMLPLHNKRSARSPGPPFKRMSSKQVFAVLNFPGIILIEKVYDVIGEGDFRAFLFYIRRCRNSKNVLLGSQK